MTICIDIYAITGNGSSPCLSIEDYRALQKLIVSPIFGIVAGHALRLKQLCKDNAAVFSP